MQVDLFQVYVFLTRGWRYYVTVSVYLTPKIIAFIWQLIVIIDIIKILCLIILSLFVSYCMNQHRKFSVNFHIKKCENQQLIFTSKGWKWQSFSMLTMYYRTADKHNINSYLFQYFYACQVSVMAAY